MNPVPPHLPYAYHDDDEFLHPDEGWLLLDRAIVYDSWLAWRHALPESRAARERLTAEAALAITALAYEVHRIHQRLPGYMRLGASPFKVSRWWDPYADDEWAAGGICLFRIDDFRGAIVKDRQEPSSQVSLRVLSEHWVEASLISEPAAILSQARAASSRRQAKSRGRQTPQTPPP